MRFIEKEYRNEEVVEVGDFVLIDNKFLTIITKLNETYTIVSLQTGLDTTGFIYNTMDELIDYLIYCNDDVRFIKSNNVEIREV